MQKKRSHEIPELTETQADFVILYRDLERQLGRPPTVGELGEARGGGTSAKAAAQQLLDKIVEKGLVTKPEYVPVGGGTTELGRAAIARLKRRRTRQ